MDELLDRAPRWALALPVLTALAIGIFYLRVVAHFEFTPDETYIYLRTAVNAAQHSGWSFHPGDGSYNVTAPLWGILVAGGAALGLDPYVVAKSFDATFAALAILALQLLVFSAAGDRVLSAWAAIIATFDAALLHWSGSGLDTSLAVLLTLLVVRYVVEDEWLVAGAALGLLVLVRIESVFLAPWLLVATRDTGWNEHLRRWLFPLSVGGAIVLAWWLTATIVTGMPFPVGIGDPSTTWTDAALAIVTSYGVPVVVMAVVVSLVPRRVDPVRRRWMRLLFGWPLILAAVHVVQGGPVEDRDLLPALVLLLAAMMVAISMWYEAGPRRWRPAIGMALAAGVAMIALNTGVYELRIAPEMRELTNGRQQAVRPIAFWLRNNTSANDEVLSAEVGLVGYVSDRRVWSPSGDASPKLRQATAGYSYDDVMLRRLYRSAVDPRFVVDRARERERLKDSTLRPIMTAEVPGLNAPDTTMQYVTLYEVVR